MIFNSLTDSVGVWGNFQVPEVHELQKENPIICAYLSKGLFPSLMPGFGSQWFAWCLQELTARLDQTRIK